MEFHEKLQSLRKEKGLTQEELAEALFVSRTAISKWESGRGYPNIDSLKALANFFSISIDELIRSENVVRLAEEDKKTTVRKYTSCICSSLDSLLVMLLFLPVFATNATPVVSAPVYALNETQLWVKLVFICVIALITLNGLFGLILLKLNRPVWQQRSMVGGMVMVMLGTMIFIATRQPYASIMFFLVFTLKILLLLKMK